MAAAKMISMDAATAALWSELDKIASRGATVASRTGGDPKLAVTNLSRLLECDRQMFCPITFEGFHSPPLQALH